MAHVDAPVEEHVLHGLGEFQQAQEVGDGASRAADRLRRPDGGAPHFVDAALGPRRFLDRVAEGRKMTVEEVDAIGGGRVWTGRQAKQRGLIEITSGLMGGEMVALDGAGFLSNGAAVNVKEMPKTAAAPPVAPKPQ